MELAKKERNELYKRAFEMYRKSHFTGLCFPIVNIAHKMKISLPLTLEGFGLEELNEERINSPKPRRSMYWWPEDDRQSRIDAFERMIKATEA